MEREIIEVGIVGAGPAGVTAAIYATRAGLSTLIFEKTVIGGNAATTYNIDNYPGFPNIAGDEFALKLFEHVNALNITIKYEGIQKIEELNEDGNKLFKVITNSKEYFVRNIIIATGSSPKKLGIPGEQTFEGKGVSFCATCDGMFFKNKKVAVIGGGNTALEDAIVLSNLCEKVYILIRRDVFRGYKSLQEKVESIENIEVLKETELVEVHGDENKMNKVTTTKGELEVDGIFVAVGIKPNSEIVKDLCELNEYGEIITDENMQTSNKGIYAVGDVRNTKVRQIITAMSDAVYAIKNISQ